jgi:hypothetical protein
LEFDQPWAQIAESYRLAVETMDLRSEQVQD